MAKKTTWNSGMSNCSVLYLLYCSSLFVDPVQCGKWLREYAGSSATIRCSEDISLCSSWIFADFSFVVAIVNLPKCAVPGGGHTGL